MRLSWFRPRPQPQGAQALRALALKADRDQRLVDAFDAWLKLAEAGDAEAAFIIGERYERGLGARQSFVESVTWFRTAAQREWTQAFGKLGEIYINGRVTADQPTSSDSAKQGAAASPGAFHRLAQMTGGVAADPAEAAKWNGRAAEAGDPKAQVRLAYQYAAGLGVERDFDLAGRWFAKAADQGEAGAQLGLGMLYAAGHGRPKDVSKAAAWFERAVAQDNVNAKVCLAVLLLEPSNGEREEERALKLLKEAADVKHREAMFLYGEYRRLGTGGESDLSEAETWLRRAALAGHVRAMVSAASLMRSREPPDLTTAAAFYREAADRGNPDAQFALGELYVSGLGVPRDPALGARWFKQAADQGVLSAYQRLGALYADGLGLEQDFLAAGEWFGKAVAQGRASANYDLGVLHHLGLGVEKSGEKAVHYYKLAADEGDRRASLRLGVLFAEGEVVEQDWRRAADHYASAAALGDADAELNLAFLMIRELGDAGRPDDGLQLLARSAEAGNEKASLALFRLYDEGAYIGADADLAGTWLLKAAERGSRFAVLELCRRLREGKPSPADPSRALELLRSLGERGDAAAQTLLGLLHHEGHAAPSDPSEALVWFTRAANQDDIFAQAWLGDVFSAGQLVPKDLVAAKGWYARAASRGHVGALLGWTRLAPPPTPDPREDQRIFDLWLERARDGDPLAQRMAGDYLVRGVRCRADLSEGVKWLRAGAAQGNAASKLILAGLMLNGAAPQEQPQEAVELLRNAALAGNLDAVHNLAICYRKGVGVTLDPAKAKEWYRRGAMQNHARSQLGLGELMLDFPEQPSELAEARTWLLTAESAGLGAAAMSLGRIYEEGLGVRKSKKLARDCYERASAAGIESAADALARCAPKLSSGAQSAPG